MRNVLRSRRIPKVLVRSVYGSRPRARTVNAGDIIMPAADLCRSPAELAQLLSGPLADADADALARHVERCDHCAAAVDQLLDRDALTALLRSQATPGDA